MARNRFLVLLAAILAMALGPRPSAQNAKRADLERVIRASGADVAVVWRPLNPTPGEEIVINGDMRFHAASTMKVPVMIELFRQASTGRLRLDDPVLVTNRFHSVVDGSEYTLSASEDSDGEVYKAIGSSLSYRALCEAMITVSSNLAANVLIDRLGAASVQSTTNALGASGMQVLRGVEDQKAFDKGMNNTTDARSLATLFERLAKGAAVDPASSDAMLAILKRQRFNEGIPSGLPPGTVVAHKTGSITRIRHDAGLVYAGRPYVLVVLVRGLDDGAVADRLIGTISRILFLPQ
jgi:beta-lactamase class A